MKDNLERFKESVDATNKGHLPLVRAIDKMESLLGGERDFPGRSQLDEVIDSTTADLNNQDPEPEGLSGRWLQLADSLTEWEQEHPGLVLAVGNVARALATAGL